MDLNDFGAYMLDRVHELFGHEVCLQLISSITGDPENEMRGKVGKEAYFEDWSHKISAFTGESVEFDVTFEWDESIGNPGAFFIKNHNHSEFFIETLILEDMHGSGPAHFVCNSWVYPAKYYKYTRIFFANQAWDRVYDYAVYNDIGVNRHILGGSKEFLYPRRGRTGRKPSTKVSGDCPRNEKFSRMKFSDFMTFSVKSLSHVFPQEIKGICDKMPKEFDSFEDMLHIYKGYKKEPVDPNSLSSSGGLELFKEIFRFDGEKPFKYPKPDVIHVDELAWRSDEEYAREMLAGVNPAAICLLQEFLPTSKLDPEVYGDHTSSITKEHIEKNLNGLTITEAMEKKKLFILDHHEEIIPYLNRINLTSSKCYATRTVLLLQEYGTLKPLAIELSLVHPDGEIHGAVDKVITPSQEGVEGSIWLLPKAYAAVNDSGCHQLISHWVYTHAVIDPFIIATNRQISAFHPIYKLLQPHFRDTMNINALGRLLLVSEGGAIERFVFPAKYAMEFSSFAYKQWVFTDSALPEDLIKRGIAVRDPSKPHGLRLLIEDYPFAVDALEVWSAIDDWVREYCSIYYSTDELVHSDIELQSWWEELRTQGHGDLKDEAWWPKMQTLEELTQSCTTMIWLASAYHAAVNFGQYPYAGYHPNRPSMSRRLFPEPALLGMSLIEILSRHSADEIYLGQSEYPDYWTRDATALEEVENKITETNTDGKLKNRLGPVKFTFISSGTQG
ncbi:hypothetical protein MKX03_012210 [Papaver bracteatum]|nr:hypothetical protein MKX03_012210 [Papaver bracteatum]